MSLQTQLENAISQIEADTALLNQIIHGDDTTTVTTDNGEVKTAAKIMKDLTDNINTVLVDLNVNAQALSNAVDSSETFSNDAQAALTAAQQVLESMAYPDVQNITFASSPVTVTAANVRNLFSVDTSGGPVVFNIDAGLTEPFSIRVKKETSDTNTVTVNTQGTETFFDGTTSKIITSIGGVDIQIDTSTSPVTWKTVSFGASAGEPKYEEFTGVLGNTTLTITQDPKPASSAGVKVNVGNVWLQPSNYTYDPDTGVFTFNEPLYADDATVFWNGGVLPIGTPGDGTVSLSKLASGLLGTVLDITNAVVGKLATCKAVFDYAQPKRNKVKVEYTETQTVTAAIPLDDTKPQDNEGTQVMSATITPQRSNSKITIRVKHYSAPSLGARQLITSLFRNGISDALDSESVTSTGNGYLVGTTMEYEDSPATTSPVTYNVNVGLNTANAMYFNGSTASRLFGGVKHAYIELEEIFV